MKTYVFLHLYYKRFANELLDYICNIKELECLYVNIPAEFQYREEIISESKVKDIIRSRVPQSEFYNFKNTGRDPGGYFRLTQATAATMSSNDIVFCIHSKSCNLSPWGDPWRQNLLHPILGTPEIASDTIGLFKNEDVGLVGSNNYKCLEYGVNIDNCTKLYERLNLPEDVRFTSFVAGTIFATRRCVLDKVYSVISEDDFSEQDNISSDGVIPHAMERMYGAVTRSIGKKVIFK